MKNPCKTLVSLMLLLLLASALFAAQAISITWNWKANSTEIVGFRYQLDGEEEALWTYVDAQTTTFTSDPLDAHVDHTLYVQQSFDNVHWSPSAKYAFDAVAYSKSSTPAILDESKAPVVPVKEPKAKREKSSKKFALEIAALGALKFDNLVAASSFDPDNNFPDLLTYVLPSVTLDFVTKNLVSMGSHLALDLRTGVSYERYKSGSSLETIHFGSARALAQLDFALSEKERVELGLGLAVTIPFANLKNGVVEDFSIKSITPFYGPMAHVAVRYQVGQKFTLGLVNEWILFLHPPFKLYELRSALRFALGWVF